MTSVVIESRLDAEIWACVDAINSGADAREAVARLELEFHRARARRYLDGEWRADALVDLMRETDPRTITGRAERPRLAGVA